MNYPDTSDGRWGELADYLESLSSEELDLFSVGSGVISTSQDEVRDSLADAASAGASPSDLLALAGQRTGVVGDSANAISFGEAALELAESDEEVAFARVCLAQTYFKGRKEPENLVEFERHCEAAVELGHAGTFCYERLLVLYEYRGEIWRAVELCRRAVEVLTAAGDETSAKRYREKLPRLERKLTD